jgi:hypothetical protein
VRSVCTCHRCGPAQRAPAVVAGPPGPQSQALHLRSSWQGACAHCRCLLRPPAASWLPAGRWLHLMAPLPVCGHAAGMLVLRTLQAHRWLRLRLRLRHPAARKGQSCHQLVLLLQWDAQALLLPLVLPAAPRCWPAAAAVCPAPRRRPDRLPAARPPPAGSTHAPPAHRQQSPPGATIRMSSISTCLVLPFLALFGTKQSCHATKYVLLRCHPLPTIGGDAAPSERPPHLSRDHAVPDWPAFPDVGLARLDWQP